MSARVTDPTEEDGQAGGPAVSRALVEQLRQAEQRYRQLVETIPAITYSHDIGMHRFTYVSPQVERVLGYGVDEYTPALWERSLHEDDRDAVISEGERTGSTGEPFSMVYRLRAADGRWIWVRDESAMLLDADGRGNAWQGVMIDVTAEVASEQALREHEARFRSVVDHLPAALYMENLDPSTFGTTFVSAQIENITGYRPDEWIEDDDLWLKIVHPDHLEEVLAAERACIETGAPFDMDVKMIRKDGSVVWVNDRTVLIYDDRGDPLYWLGSFHDITEKKHAEQEVARALELERRSVERLEALDEQKNMFLTATSHEMRTPLASIMGSARTLQHLASAVSEDDRNSMIEAIVGNAASLAKILDDLLDLDRVRHGVLEARMVPVRLDEVVSSALSTATLSQTHRVEADLPATVVFADQPMVERIVENLIVNAGRYAPQGARVWIRTGRVAGGIGLVVEDDGPGVPPGLRDVLFEPFRQGHNTQAHSPGIGVGLALVAKFAELHGGRAWVEEREGGGASFRILLAPDPTSTDVTT